MSVLRDDREAYPKGKQSPKCRICLLQQEIASGRHPRNDIYNSIFESPAKR